MSYQTWVQTLVSAQIDGTAITNSNAATTLLPAAARYTIPANFFQIGQALRVRAMGRISTVVTTPGNLTFTFQLGPSGTIGVFASQATALNIVAQTNATWWLDLMLTCRAIGNGSVTTFMGAASFISRASLNAPAVGTTTGVGAVLMPDTAPAVGTGCDSTVANIADLFATFSIANAANSIQLHQYTLEAQL